MKINHPACCSPLDDTLCVPASLAFSEIVTEMPPQLFEPRHVPHGESSEGCAEETPIASIVAIATCCAMLIGIYSYSKLGSASPTLHVVVRHIYTHRRFAKWWPRMGVTQVRLICAVLFHHFAPTA